MKSFIATATVLLASTFAKADGFICQSESGVVLKVYNHTSADVGTRSASVMILSDATVGEGNKTIAKFSADNSTLSSSNVIYTAHVDLRFNDSTKKGEYLAGTRLGYVKDIVLQIDFTYNSPVVAGTELGGAMLIVKRNGEEITEDVNCSRYLKN